MDGGGVPLIDPVTLLSEAYAVSGEVVAGIRPEDLERPTPCASWNVRDVLNHLVGVITKFTEFATGGTDRPHHPSGNLLGEDYIGSFNHAATASLAGWRRYPWTSGGPCRLPFGTFTASTVVGIIVFDTLLHGWDIATAIGRPIDRSPEVWEFGWRTASEVVREPRDRRQFGQVIETTALTPDAELLAFLGRQPGGGE